MSLSVYMALEAKNKKGEWESICFMVPSYDGEKKLAGFDFPNGCHDIFTMLNYEHSGAYDSISAVQAGLPNDVSAEVKEAFEKWSDGEYKPHAQMINLADLHIELMKNPKVVDYEVIYDEEDESKAWIDNPLKEVYDKAVAWMTVWTANTWEEWIESNVRIIGWVM